MIPTRQPKYVAGNQPEIILPHNILKCILGGWCPPLLGPLPPPASCWWELSAWTTWAGVGLWAWWPSSTSLTTCNQVLSPCFIWRRSVSDLSRLTCFNSSVLAFLIMCLQVSLEPQLGPLLLISLVSFRTGSWPPSPRSWAKSFLPSSSGAPPFWYPRWCPYNTWLPCTSLENSSIIWLCLSPGGKAPRALLPRLPPGLPLKLPPPTWWWVLWACHPWAGRPWLSPACGCWPLISTVPTLSPV